MNDSERGDERPPTRYDQAREALLAAVNNHEVAIYNIGYDRGFDAGWDAAVRRMGAVMQNTPPEPRPPPPLPDSTIGGSDLSAKEVVLEIIKRNPGLRGVEIVQETDRNSSGRLNERTVRTALHRLKADGLISNDDGRWHVAPQSLNAPTGDSVDGAPAGAGSSKGGSQMEPP